MIITQTPLRISFFGGGTDFSKYYQQEEGCVLSSTIDKYIYVLVKERFDEKIRVGYTQTELVESVEQLQHDLVREALIHIGIDKQIEIDTIGDIPTSGSGLGSSSTVLVGVLNALYTYLNNPPTQEKLALDACQIEIDCLQKPIGKQDQYIVAFGGFRFIRFFPDNTVAIENVNISNNDKRRLNQHLLLFYTNTTRKSSSILAEQNERVNHHLPILRELKSMAQLGKKLLESGDFDDFGYLLHESWQLKKQLASKISNPRIDEIYDIARKAGAIGGKITGAGGGGFLLLYCPRETVYDVRDALSEFKELPFHLEPDGSKVILNYRK